MPEDALQMVLSQVTDQNLRHTLQFGIGLHHAGLNDKDRSLVEELFANNKIQAHLSLTWSIILLIWEGHISKYQIDSVYWLVGASMHEHTCLGGESSCSSGNYQGKSNYVYQSSQVCWRNYTLFYLCYWCKKELGIWDW